MGKRNTSSSLAPPTLIANRKAKRKQERNAKKKRQRTKVVEEQLSAESLVDPLPEPSRKKKKTKKTKVSKPNSKKQNTKGGHKYDHLDPDVAAALRNDDEEIAFLEASLGVSKNKQKLNKEYAKLEGYGNDFGDFLTGLDGLVGNMIEGIAKEYEDIEGLEYDSDESDLAAARAKYLIRQEALGNQVQEEIEGDRGSSSDEEELVPMKSPVMVKSDAESVQKAGSESEDDSENKHESGSEEVFLDQEDEEEDSDQTIDSSAKQSRDHDEKDTYRPAKGQDLYGNNLNPDDQDQEKPTKYIPPHLRNKTNHETIHSRHGLDDDDPERQETLRSIKRMLNNNLNRLSMNTLESVTKSLSSLYQQQNFSSRDVNERLYLNLKMACIVPHMVNTGLIPLYMASMAGVHFQTKENILLGAFLLERVVLNLWSEIKNQSQEEAEDHEMDESNRTTSKKAANLMLVLCYLYNYNIIHCTMIYDLIRHFIESFSEVEVELLLLTLSHCGSQLRSDDPSALKDIVLLVQERSVTIQNADSTSSKTKVATSSRAQFMVQAISDLKNNKRKRNDTTHDEKTSQYRKAIGRMKAQVTAMKGGRAADSSGLRISLKDILDIETKGRWWKVGAIWKGNQHHANSKNVSYGSNPLNETELEIEDFQTTDKQKRLLKLAKKQRMNSDLRRSIFCIIMGSNDCQEALKSFIQNDMFIGKTDREIVRVLVHCCGSEKFYNPYYAHLADRVCEYQANCNFTFQLTFWDSFQQFDDMKARKAANLAKLLACLLIKGYLNLNVLKPIDIRPDDMAEPAIIFLTILFSTLFDELNADDLKYLFQRGDGGGKKEEVDDLFEGPGQDINEDDLYATAGSEREALKENISIFLMHYLESSPKNVKHSSFRKNLKVSIKACESDGLEGMF